MFRKVPWRGLRLYRRPRASAHQVSKHRIFRDDKIVMFASSTDLLKQAVEIQLGGSATFVQSVPVHESFKWQTIWNGSVHIFNLADSPSGATRVYAWSCGLPDGSRRCVAIPHIPPVVGPKEAVRAVITAEMKGA